MEEYSAPPPLLTGEGEERSHRGRHHWMLVSLLSFVLWLTAWSLLVYAILNKQLEHAPDWLSTTLAVAALATCAFPFAPLLVGLLSFRTRQGKVTVLVSGLQALVIFLFGIAVFVAVQKKR